MKRLTAPLLALSLVVAIGSYAWAAESTGSASLSRDTNKLLQEFKTASRSAERVTSLKAATVKLIDSRTADINRLITKVTNLTTITASDKTAILADLANAKTGLQTLEAKIQADTDLTTIKADTKLIFTNFRVFAVLGPKVSGLIVADRVNFLIGRLQTTTAKLTALVAQAKATGKDTTQMSALLSDYQTQITAAQSQVAAAKVSFEAMSVSDVTAAKAAFQAGKADLRTARTDLSAARKDLQQLIPLLKATLPVATGSAATATESGH